jgi:tetratricopeptide (TPR) repeat protein
MRTILFRAVLAPAILLALAAGPAFAQSVVRGKVVDQEGNAVEGATVVFEDESGSRRLETRTNRNGEYQQLGMASGDYKVTASKDGVGLDMVTGYAVRQQLNPVLDFTLQPDSGRGPDLTTGADGTRLPDAVIKQIEGAVSQAFDAMAAQEFDTAIEQFDIILTHVPACVECHFNVAVAHAQSGRMEPAEQAFLKVIELEPESADAYRGLAAVYNAQRRFDDAAKANEKAIELGGDAGAAGADASSADVFYNQGVVLWNGGQAAKAKEQFERAAAADPTMAMPHYYIGLASLNLGQVAEALASFEKYLELEPEGEKAGEVKAFVSQLR